VVPDSGTASARCTAPATSRTSTNAPSSQNGVHSESGPARHRASVRWYMPGSQTMTGRSDTVGMPDRSVKPAHRSSASTLDRP
jgi:hypothetical protein